MNQETIYQLAYDVIEIEAKTIKQLKQQINPNFLSACHYLFNCQGRIIVMGIGKSGHIAKKIAATLASTGTPAFFVHPSEAKHGDMGMLTKQDVVLILSYSGESDEIITVLPCIKRLNIPLISLTGKPKSTLAKAAHINLDVSIEKEACPLGLAPTASTTAALVMGDALAMVLLNMRGFTTDDFARTHPGGTLGRKLLLHAEDIMHQGEHIPKVSTTASISDALIEITQKKLGVTTVIQENGQLCGIFTDGDVRRILSQPINIHHTPIEQVMSAHPKTIPPKLLAAQALNIMETHKITLLVVVNEDHHPIGVVHIHDILRAGVI